MSRMTLSRLFLAVLLGAGLKGPAAGAGPYHFYQVTPCRLVDTISGPFAGTPLVAGESRAYPVRGSCGVPTAAKAVLLTATILSPSGAGYLVLYPAATSLPSTSNANFSAGDISVSNAALIELSDGSTNIRAGAAISGFHMRLDVVGYYQ